MAMTRVWVTGWTLLLVFGRLSCAGPIRVPSSPVCYTPSVTDSILGLTDPVCPLNGFVSFDVATVIEGNEAMLQSALNMVHRNMYDYVAVLFYASWCPFSTAFRPTFSLVPSLYTSIPHFAIEESSIKPSVLSKYGVHGLPALFLMNSTMRVRYHGSRTPASLMSFYADITGIKTASMDILPKGKTRNSPADIEPRSPPFTWVQSPKHILQQETYLALATVFVLLRLLYFILPSVLLCGHSVLRNNSLNLRLRRVWERPSAYLIKAKQLFGSLKEPFKRRNLQGAINAKAWASKSLASVSLGEASGSRVLPVN